MAAIGFSQVVVENAMITPVGLAFRDPDKPTSIADQDWLIHFSSIGVVDLKGNNANDWRREILFTSLISPGPCNGRSPSTAFRCRPRRSAGWWRKIRCWSSRLQSMRPSAQLSRNHPAAPILASRWIAGRRVISPPASNLFTGINIDLAVRNTNAVIHGVSYQVTIKGKIAFVVQR